MAIISIIKQTMSTEKQPDQSEFPQVLIFRPFGLLEHQELLEKKFRFLKPWESPMPRDDFLAAHSDLIRLILCFGPVPYIGAGIMGLLPKLECVVASSAGLDHIDVAECRRRGIALCNAGEAFSDDVADYAAELLMDVLRGISAADRYVRRGLWPVKGEFPLGSKLGGKRVGILGLGSIGSRVARRLEAFGCIVSYHSRTKKPSFSYRYVSNVRDLASDSDVLIVTCALTSETHHIINKEVMSALGKEGVIVNVGRGALIDEKELVRCLMEGVIGGAGLDVFENEPMVPEELFQMDNVVLSPHRAVLTPESFYGLLQVVIDNLEAFFANKPLLTPVLD